MLDVQLNKEDRLALMRFSNLRSVHEDLEALCFVHGMMIPLCNHVQRFRLPSVHCVVSCSIANMPLLMRDPCSNRVDPDYHADQNAGRIVVAV